MNTIRHTTLLLFVLFSFSSIGWSQGCDTNSLIVLPVRASDTDPAIPWELFRHFTFYNPDCVPKNKLLVHMVGTGGDPFSTEIFPSVAANNGFHVVSLKYHNDTSAQTACNNSPDVDCHFKFRKEIIEGVDYSPETVVDATNSINNRLLKLIQYMDATYPTQNWGQFYTGSTMNWNKVLTSGHSQGGGHAAVMGIENNLNRVLMFASPNDYSTAFTQMAPWLNMTHATPDSAYYSFNNLNDLIGQFSWQYTAAINLGEGAFGDTVNVDYNDCPYSNSRNLYTSIDQPGLTDHGSVVTDNNTPLDAQNQPVFKDVWLYMLGVNCPTNSLSLLEGEAMNVYPNPFDDVLKVSFESAGKRTVSLLSMKGEVLLVERDVLGDFSLETGAVLPGVYLLQVVEEDGGVWVRKVVK